MVKNHASIIFCSRCNSIFFFFIYVYILSSHSQCYIMLFFPFIFPAQFFSFQNHAITKSLHYPPERIHIVAVAEAAAIEDNHITCTHTRCVLSGTQIHARTRITTQSFRCGVRSICRQNGLRDGRRAPLSSLTTKRRKKEPSNRCTMYVIYRISTMKNKKKTKNMWHGMRTMAILNLKIVRIR